MDLHLPDPRSQPKVGFNLMPSLDARNKSRDDPFKQFLNITKPDDGKSFILKETKVSDQSLLQLFLSGGKAHFSTGISLNPPYEQIPLTDNQLYSKVLLHLDFSLVLLCYVFHRVVENMANKVFLLHCIPIDIKKNMAV